VVEAMLPFFTDNFANPSSHHYFGEKANKVVNDSRKLVSTFLNAEPQEIIFTAGATESINLIIKGITETCFKKGNHIITSQTEHSAVLGVCKYLEKRGFEIEYLPVDRFGLIDIADLKSKMREDTILVSIIYVNNETGVIQPIDRIAKLCQEKNITFFTDATQAVGKIPINVKELKIDLMSFSGHKFYGPKGIGGLYCNKNLKLEPLLHGGGQERGLRSGTLNVPGIVGLAKAFEIAIQEMQTNKVKIKSLRDDFEKSLLRTNKVRINGHPTDRLFNVSNLCFTETDPSFIAQELINVAYSQGSACNSSSIAPSHVLKAMGLSDEKALSSFRFSFGKYNTREEINSMLALLKSIMSSQKVLN
jgi:cysteine desulfurase